MTNLYRIGTTFSDKSFLGKLLRVPLSFIPGSFHVRMRHGIRKGHHWIIGSGTHSQWLGSFELPKQIAFTQAIEPGYVVLDVGAHVGFFTLMASVLVGDNGLVIAFEPSHRNLVYLKEHVKLNHAKNVKIIEVAVSVSHGSARFDQGQNSFGGSLSETGEYVVDMVNLDDLYAVGTIPRADVIKIDVEGLEVEVLTGSRKLILDCRPTIFLETHTLETYKECLSLLNSWFYSVEILDMAGATRELHEIVARPIPE